MTDEERDEILRLISDLHMVPARAARVVGFTRQAVTMRKKRDPEFRRLFEQAEARGEKNAMEKLVAHMEKSEGACFFVLERRYRWVKPIEKAKIDSLKRGGGGIDPKRGTKLRPHPAQAKLCMSTARFDVIEAGRRSGKTELPKRLGVLEAMRMGPIYAQNGLTWYTKFCSPTRDQSKTIFWDDLKALTEPWCLRDPSESDLQLFLLGGAQIWVCGLDKPARIEGSPVDRLAVDELAEVKDGAWERNLYPALGTTGRNPGRAWLFGVPRPGGQFSDLAKKAKDPTEPDYAYHTWTSEGIVEDRVFRAAKRGDPLMFAQEWLGQLPLLLAFDFNRSPGVAVVSQEQALAGLYVAYCASCGVVDPGRSGEPCSACKVLLPLETATCVVGEVHIKRGSNTTIVCTKLCNDWRHHKGQVFVYGDATGGAKKSSSVDGSDWDLIRQYFARDFPQAIYDVDKSNPAERARVNAVVQRACNAMGERRLFVDPMKAPNLARDFEEQLVLSGGSGELDKDSDKTLGHAADGIGYQIHKLYPAVYGDPTAIEAL